MSLMASGGRALSGRAGAWCKPKRGLVFLWRGVICENVDLAGDTHRSNTLLNYEHLSTFVQKASMSAETTKCREVCPCPLRLPTCARPLCASPLTPYHEAWKPRSTAMTCCERCDRIWLHEARARTRQGTSGGPHFNLIVTILYCTTFDGACRA